MIKPLTSSKVNPNPYNVQDLLRPNQSAPDLRKLLTLVDILLNLAPLEDQSIKSTLIEYLLRLANPQAPKAIKSWARKQLLFLRCRECKNAPSDSTKSQIPLCSLCYENQISKSKCLNCLLTYNDSSLLTPCKHICIFCCNMLIKKSKKNCQICSTSFKPVRSLIDSLQLTCSDCTLSKTLSNEPFTRLECSHFLCSRCVRSCISKSVCPVDSVPLSSKTKNIALEYISDTCYLCKTRKKREKITFKTCCPVTLCIKCTKIRSKCPNCLTPLSPQINSQY